MDSLRPRKKALPADYDEAVQWWREDRALWAATERLLIKQEERSSWLEHEVNRLEQENIKLKAKQ
jgi:hypothetical protein